jgi:hypothetical protein
MPITEKMSGLTKVNNATSIEQKVKIPFLGVKNGSI